MFLRDCAITLEELTNATKSFVNQECENKNGRLEHKKCGGAIRKGFLNLFYINENGSLDPGEDGFGIGPKKVPYCEKCFPPDGHNYSYAVRFPILKEERKRPEGYVFYWGNMQTNTRLLPG